MKRLCKCIWFIVLMGLALGGCNGVKPQPSTLDQPVFTDFEPVTPEIAPGFTDYTSSGPRVQRWAKLSLDEKRSRLSQTDRLITIQRYDGSTKLTYLAGNATLSAGQYRITLTHYRFRPERVTDGQALCGNNTVCEPLSLLQMGVGTKLVAEVFVGGGGVNTGSLLPLGIDVSGQSVSGRMRLVTFGVVPKKTGLSIPGLALKVDEASIQAMLQAIAVLETQIDGSDVELTPYILGVKSQTPPKGTISDARTANLDAGVRGFTTSTLKSLGN